MRKAAVPEGQMTSMTYDSTQADILSWGLRGSIWGLKRLFEVTEPELDLGGLI